MTKAHLLFRLLQQRRELKQREHWDRKRLESYQSQALDRLRAFVYTHSPFYQRFHKGRHQAPLNELPILTKSLLMENFDDLVTDRNIHLKEIREHLDRLPGEEKYQGRYWTSVTSGSVGHPSMNLFNDTEWAGVLASAIRSYDWAGVRIRPFHRTRSAAIVSAKPTAMTARVTGTFHFRWFPTLRILPSESLVSTVDRLNAWQPEILQGFSYMVALLAEEQLAGRLRISPRVIATGGDLLAKSQGNLIEAAWQGRRFDRYATGEFGVLASECAHHRGLHLYEDLAIVEVVDQENRLVPPGKPGTRVLVTALTKYTQPLIRYELSDLVRLSADPCPCGRSLRLIGELQGRTQQTLYFPSPTQGRLAVPPDVFHRVIDGLPIIGWQIVQDREALTVHLRAVPEDFSDEALADALRYAISAMGAIAPPIRVERVSQIPCEANGKAPLIKSNIQENFEAAP
jgi:phenylacetate-CoA ligase